MLGMIYTEYLNMVETAFGVDIADEMIEQSLPNLPSKAIYTAVGNYSHKEIIVLVSCLSELTKIEVTDLVKTFGEHLFGRFHVRYPEMFNVNDNAFTFLEKVEGYIHVKVASIYPLAELPSFRCHRRSDTVLVMDYRSQRPFATLAHGMILGCLSYFGQTATVVGEALSDDLLDGYPAGYRFVITDHG